MNEWEEPESDKYWKSNTVRRATSWFIVTTMTALLAGFGWNIAKTAELESRVNVQQYRVDRTAEDVKEIKDDVKTLLKRIP